MRRLCHGVVYFQRGHPVWAGACRQEVSPGKRRLRQKSVGVLLRWRKERSPILSRCHHPGTIYVKVKSALTYMGVYYVYYWKSGAFMTIYSCELMHAWLPALHCM